MREVGTLLIAFAPLDAALSEGPMPTAAFLLLFLGLWSHVVRRRVAHREGTNP